MFLVEAAKKQFLITIHVNTERARYEAILSQVTAEGDRELARKNLPDSFDSEAWNLYELGLISSKFFLVLNKKELLFDMQDLVEADGKAGTIGFGINGMKAEFSDIEMDCLSKGPFLKYIESLRKIEEYGSDEVTVEDMEFTTDPVEGEDSTAEGTERTEPLASYEPCISISSSAERVKWINENVSETSNVQFCPACCDTLAMPPTNAQCRTGCEGAITIAATPSDMFDGCFAAVEGMAMPELYQSCVLCVDDIPIAHPEVMPEVIVIKRAECADKFRSCTDPIKCSAGSYAQNAEGE